MNELETGKDKIKKICEILKNESLEPAKEEAQKIITEAQEESARMIQEAKQKADELFEANRKMMERERVVFEGSLSQACKQGMEALRQKIQEQFFNAELASWVKNNTTDPQIAAKLIEVLVEAVKKEGISANFSALIPSTIPAEKVNVILAKNILEKLKEKSVVVGDFNGGVRIKLHDQQLTLDLSDQAIYELLEKYLSRDFRELLFKPL